MSYKRDAIINGISEYCNCVGWIFLYEFTECVENKGLRSIECERHVSFNDWDMKLGDEFRISANFGIRHALTITYGSYNNKTEQNIYISPDTKKRFMSYGMLVNKIKKYYNYR